MVKARTALFCLVLLSMALMLVACGPSEEQLRARDEARSAALAAEQRADNLEQEYEDLTAEIPELESEVEALQAELAELQAEYEALGGGSR
jgi:uncharacterized protein YlxW (UPF0749 family)